MTYLLLFLFALAPSLIWLAFYLRKDSHPEPNRMVLKIFLAGMLITIPAIAIETFLEGFFVSFEFSRLGFLLIYFFVGIALVEELLKYVVVRLGVFSNSALDEPLDFMLYMVIAALGFAAFENILLLFKLVQLYPASDIFLVNTVRFLQAIFLHALVSALLGYFLALSFFQSKYRFLLFLAGISCATALHGSFNLYIFTIGDQGLLYLFLPLIPLFALAMFISFGFQQLKKQTYATKPQPI
ncbi:MAG TPA: PrsW family intramembrane metalloprotease [Candidatus Paceibacterota bacterium]|nr:PrsW family intramembrane metalloprotease [Candidatus Paceibacterota bacterium]